MRRVLLLLLLLAIVVRVVARPPLPDCPIFRRGERAELRGIVRGALTVAPAVCLMVPARRPRSPH